MLGGVESFRSTTDDLWPPSSLRLAAAGTQPDSKLLFLESLRAESAMAVMTPALKPLSPDGRMRSELHMLRAAFDSELWIPQMDESFSSITNAAAHRASLRYRLERLDAKTRVAKQEAAAATATMDLIRPKSPVNPTSTSPATNSVPPLASPTASSPAPTHGSVALKAPSSRYASPSNMKPPRPIRPKYVSSPGNERREARRASSTVCTRSEQQTLASISSCTQHGPVLTAAKAHWIKQYGPLSGHAMEAYSEQYHLHNQVRFLSASSH